MKIDKLMPPIKILLFSSDPKGAGHLRTNDEFEKIMDALRYDKINENNNKKFKILISNATTPYRMVKDIREFEPHIIHISSHGATKHYSSNKQRSLDIENDDFTSKESNYIYLQDENGHISPLKSEVFSNIIQPCNNLLCVILNLCNSAKIAKDIVKHTIVTIGTSVNIEDERSINFSKGFYSSLYANADLAICYSDGCKSYNDYEDMDGERYYKIHINEEHVLYELIITPKLPHIENIIQIVESHYTLKDISKFYYAFNQYSSSCQFKEQTTTKSALHYFLNRQKNNKPIPFISFIKYISNSEVISKSDATLLMAWTKQACLSFAIDQSELIAPISSSDEIYLMIELWAEDPNIPNCCSWQAWIHINQKTIDITKLAANIWLNRLNNKYETIDLSDQETKGNFIKLIASIKENCQAQYQTERGLSIEIFTDINHFSTNFYTWFIKEENELNIYLSCYSERPIVLRSRKRLRDVTYRALLKSINPSCNVEILNYDPMLPCSFNIKAADKLSQKNKSIVAFNFNTLDNECSRKILLRTLLKGASVLFWPQDLKDDMIENYHKEYSNKNAHAFLEKLKEISDQISYEEEPDYHPTLIWDDNTRMPINELYSIED